MARLYMTGIKGTVDFGFLCNKYFIVIQIFSLIALSSCSDASLDRSNNGKMDPVKFNISKINQTNQNNEITTNNNTNEHIQFSSTTLDQNTSPHMKAENINMTDVNIERNSTEYKQTLGFNESSTISVNKRKKIDVIASLRNLQDRKHESNNTENVSIRSRKKKTNRKKYKKSSKILNRKKNSRRRGNRKLAKMHTKKIKHNTLSKKLDNITSIYNISNVNNSLNFDNSSNSFDNCTLSLGKKRLDINFNENKNTSLCPGFSEYYTVHSTTNKCKTNLTINDRQKREENSEQVDGDNTPEEMEFYDLDTDYDLYSEQNVIKGIQNDESVTNTKTTLKKGGKRRKKQKNKNQLKQNSTKTNDIVTDSYINHPDISSKADIMKREEIDENTALLYLMKSLLDNDIIDNVDEVLPNKSNSILQLINNNVQNDWAHQSKKEAGVQSTDKVSYPFHFNIYFYNNQEEECSSEASDILSYPIIMPTRIPDLMQHQDDPGGSEKKGMFRESFMDYGRTSNSENSLACPGGCNMGSVVLAVLGVFIAIIVLGLLGLYCFKRYMCIKNSEPECSVDPKCPAVCCVEIKDNGPLCCDPCGQ